jgi:hypothetical protein
MAIARFENVTVNNLTFGTDSYGQGSTTIAPWFVTRAKVMDVNPSVGINKDDRVYQERVKFMLNFTPNTLNMSNNQNLYSFTWRNQDWRIDDVMESNDRMNITFHAYRNDPVPSV